MKTQKNTMAVCSQSAVKRIAAFILSFVMLFTLSAGMDLSVFAADYVPRKSGDFTYIVTDDRKTAVISEYTGNAAKVSVPDTLDGYKIVIIGPDAFAGNKNIETVELPESIDRIGFRAFKDCTNLKKVTMRNGVEGIESNAFENCISLSEIVLSDSLKSLKNYVFSNCTSLKTIKLPNSLESITDYAFYGCTSLESIYILNRLTTIYYGAFENCSSLKDVYYSGTQDEWNSISIENKKNEYLINADIHYSYGVVADNKFSDIQGFAYAPYSDYVMYTSVYNNFINGTNPPYNTEFSPQTAITRAMFVTILYRMAGEPYKNANPYKASPFSDIKNTGVYYYDAACWALDNEITNQTTFKPYDNVSREQTASFLFRYAQANDMITDEAYKTVNLSAYHDYNNIRDWSKEAMQWANYNGMITGTQQGYANPQGSTLRIHATKILYGFGVVCNIGNFE